MANVIYNISNWKDLYQESVDWSSDFQVAQKYIYGEKFAEAEQKLFSPFYTSKHSGTGLGLAICRKLVDAHGGAIELSSEPGRGCEFVVTLPKLPGARR